MTNDATDLLDTLQRSLHACPEGSGKEVVTSRVIAEFLTGYAPTSLVTQIGGHGILATFDGAAPGPTVMVRAELDAIVTDDRGGNGTTSTFAHRCGHDCHMTMVAGIAPLLHDRGIEQGRVMLLFQPAEETGAGAAEMLADPRFTPHRPDAAIALHNMPGWPERTVVVRNGVLTSASVGLKIELRGAASHAAEPEKGRSPASALSSLLEELPQLNRMHDEPYHMITITHARMGRESFGVSPGRAWIFATLRATTRAALAELQSTATATVERHSDRCGLAHEIEWLEAFPEIDNSPEIVRHVEAAAAANGCDVATPDVPFRWSDDFGHFAEVCPIAYFGLGTGEGLAGLHHPDYRFPRPLLPLGREILFDAAVRTLADLTTR